MKVKNVLLIAVASLFVLASCGKENDGVNNKAVTANFGKASMTVTATTGENMEKGDVKYNRRTSKVIYSSASQIRNIIKAGGPVYASFYVRIDGAVPDNEVNTNHWVSQDACYYYPEGFPFVTRQVDASKMGPNLFVIDRYGAAVKACLLDEPTMADMKAHFYSNVLKYHDTVIYDKARGIDLLNDYKIIWYVIKYQGTGDNVIHVDGAIVPKNATSTPVSEDESEEIGGENDQTEETYNEQDDENITVNVNVNADLLIQFDDFDIRHSGQDGYVYYQRDIDANSLTYNELTLSRDEHMNVNVTGLNKLDWSGENTVWTFETWMWAKDLPKSEYGNWKQDTKGTIDSNLIYNVEYQVFQGFQSNGTVPYVKVSIHVTKK